MTGLLASIFSQEGLEIMDAGLDMLLRPGMIEKIEALAAPSPLEVGKEALDSCRAGKLSTEATGAILAILLKEEEAKRIRRIN